MSADFGGGRGRGRVLRVNVYCSIVSTKFILELAATGTADSPAPPTRPPATTMISLAQAEDRAHRLGQTQPVEVIRLIVQGSIEDRVLDIQSKKRELFKCAFDATGKADVSRQRLELLKELFDKEQ